MTKKSIAIIGAGRVGSSVGFLLQRAGGYEVTAVASRTPESAKKAAAFIGSRPVEGCAQAARAEIVFITTPDGAIRGVCEQIAAAGGFLPGAVAVHMSGAHSLGLLDAARSSGAYRAVLHPLQSLANREQGVKTLPGSFFRIEADPEALKTARSLVKALGGIELALRNWKPDEESAALYHAAAVAVSNYFVALIDYGLRFYEALGANRQDALKAVLPLIKGTLHNIETAGIPGALTGPIVRGDVETVRDHVRAIRKRAPHLLDLYRALAEQTITVAKDRGTLSPEALAELSRVIEQANPATGHDRPER